MGKTNNYRGDSAKRKINGVCENGNDAEMDQNDGLWKHAKIVISQTGTAVRAGEGENPKLPSDKERENPETTIDKNGAQYEAIETDWECGWV